MTSPRLPPPAQQAHEGLDNVRTLRVEGDGTSRGTAHGEEFRSLIGQAMERWREALVFREQREFSGYIQEFLASTGFAATAKELSPDLYAEVEGIASGSNQPFEDILVYNLMDEEWRHDRDPAIGCSTIGTFVRHEESSATAVLGQNMDLPASMGGSQVVLQIEGDGDPDQTVLSGAGMIGLLGVNASGVAICVNTLRSLPAASTGLPVAFIIRELLRRRNAVDAALYLRSVPHASGQHYAIGDPTGVRGYECSSEGCISGPASQHLLHTNHVLWAADDEDSNTPEAFESHGTRRRMSSLLEGLQGISGFGDIQALLSSADNGLCVVPTPARRVTTFCAAEFLLTVPPAIRVAAGRPDQVRWHDIGWPVRSATGSAGD